MQWPNLVDVLSGIRWAIVGGVATRLYMQERTTLALDVMILPADRDVVAHRLREAGYEPVGRLALGGSTWKAPDGTPVDVVEGTEAWWPDALEAAARNLDTVGAPVLTAPYLLLMKLMAGRVQDIAGVTRILGRLDERGVESVRALIDEKAADLREDLESLIVLGRLEEQG